MAVQPLLPIDPPVLDAARPSARRRAAPLLALLLAALVLLAPLSACAQSTAEGPEEPRPAEPASQAPVASPTERAPGTEDPASPRTAPPSAADGTARTMLAGLEVKGRAPKTGYDRDSFGWRDDLDRNGCDTRNDVLRRDLDRLILTSGTDGCVVLRGSLDSPYSGATVGFDRTASLIDIDHVVALSDAWQSGAASWDEGTRREFANDPLNLLAVESGLNRQKGAGDAATWLPPAKDHRCQYVARQIAVKTKYELWVKPAEAEAMERVLDDCEGFPAVADDDPWPAPGHGDVMDTQTQPAPTPAPQPAPAGEGGPGAGVVHFENCDAARAAGAAPVRTGDPGYGQHLDRDGNGVGCE